MFLKKHLPVQRASVSSRSVGKECSTSKCVCSRQAYLLLPSWNGSHQAAATLEIASSTVPSTAVRICLRSLSRGSRPTGLSSAESCLTIASSFCGSKTRQDSLKEPREKRLTPSCADLLDGRRLLQAAKR